MVRLYGVGKFLIGCFFLFSFLSSVRAQNLEEQTLASVEELLIQVDAATLENRYKKALSLLEQGKAVWPEDYRVPMRAGKLYRHRELYALALAEFRSILKIESALPATVQDEVYLEISDVLGYLGKNQEAINMLESLKGRTIIPQFHNQIIDNLSWFYFKTHQIQNGITLLEEEAKTNYRKELGMTLGTLYSAAHNFEKSRLWYIRSINEGLAEGDEYFASVGYYNLSLLEISFYRYREARNWAERAKELYPRAGSDLILGELDLNEWNLDSAIRAFQDADSLSKTPLPMIDIADFYQRVGRLDETIRFVKKIKSNPDGSWMYRYGTTQIQFEMNLNKILAAAWKGKARVEKRTPKAGIERFFGLYRRIFWFFRGLYHQRRYRALSFVYARQLQIENNELDSSWNAYLSTEGYKNPSLRNLERARILESEIAPLSAPWYALEAGKEIGNAALLQKALNTFLPEEQDPREKTLRALALLPRNRIDSVVRNTALRRLYKMNPGGFRQYGITLPVRINVKGFKAQSLKRTITVLLRRAGHSLLKAEDDSRSAFSTLTVMIKKSGESSWFLSSFDGQTRARARAGTDIGRKEVASLLAELFNGLYTTQFDDDYERD